MSTIRIPKNLMYLSDKLPRPSYEAMKKEDAATLRNTTDEKGYSLPAIPGLPAQKHSRQSQVKSIAEIYNLKSDPSRAHRRRKLKRLPKKSEASPAEKPTLPDVGASSKTVIQTLDNRREEPAASIPLHVTRGKEPQRIVGAAAAKNLAAIAEESPKRDGDSPIMPPHGRAERDEADRYIHHLVARKSPIRAQQPDINMLRIANIYSGNNAERIISLQKRKIDRILEISRKDRGLAKSRLHDGAYNLVPYLDPTLKSVRQRGLENQGVLPEGMPQLKIRYPLKATRANSNVPRLPDSVLKGIVGSRYLHGKGLDSGRHASVEA